MSIVPFDSIPSELWVKFTNQKEYEERKEELFEAIKYSDGNDVVVAYFVEEKKKLILPPSKNVKVTPKFIEELKEKFGQKNIGVV